MALVDHHQLAEDLSEYILSLTVTWVITGMVACVAISWTADWISTAPGNCQEISYR